MMYGYGNMISPSNRLFIGGGGGANPLWNGLQAYYTADNTPNDALGNYNGTLVNGATYGTGIINQGFILDGVNDYVDLGNVLDFDASTPFSFSFWVQNTTLTDRAIMGKWSGSNTGYLIFMISGKLRFSLSNNVSTNLLRIDTVNSLTTAMTHICITYDGTKDVSGLKVYFNGVNQSLTTINNTLTGSTSTSANFNIGLPPSGLNYFGGIIDEVSIFNAVKIPSEVTELYNSGAGKQYPN